MICTACGFDHEFTGGKCLSIAPRVLDTGVVLPVPAENPVKRGGYQRRRVCPLCKRTMQKSPAQRSREFRARRARKQGRRIKPRKPR